MKVQRKNNIYKKNYDAPVPLSASAFQKIVQFYLFECPSEKKDKSGNISRVSKRGKSFRELGWAGVTQFAQLKNNLLNAATPSLKPNYHSCKKEELPIRFKEVESVSPVDEYCVFLKNDVNRVMDSLFSAIRNAIAHGSFSVHTYSKVKIYFFANHDGYLKAEIILQENTLLNWINIIRSGPS